MSPGVPSQAPRGQRPGLHERFRRSALTRPSIADYIEHDIDPGDVLGALPDARVIAVGHTHRPFAEYVAADGSGHRRFVPGSGADDPGRSTGRDPGQSLAMPAGARLVMNVGSVGQPRDHDWRACWVELELDDAGSARAVTWHREEYDVDAAMDAVIAAGLPTMLAERLLEGY